METHYTYILYSETINQFYKGSTKDVAERLNRHNAKREKATKAGAPWKLIWFTEKGSKAEAIKLENKLKNLSRKRLIQLMLKYENGITDDKALSIIHKIIDTEFEP